MSTSQPQPTGSNPVAEVALNSTNLETSKKYWKDLLQMKALAEKSSILLSYDDNQASLRIQEIQDSLNRAKEHGHISYAVPLDVQPRFDEIIKAASPTVITPLSTLEIPVKTNVRVIILAHRDGHEICFVDEEGFTQLSYVDPKGDELLDRYIKKDPFQPK